MAKHTVVRSSFFQSWRHKILFSTHQNLNIRHFRCLTLYFAWLLSLKWRRGSSAPNLRHILTVWAPRHFAHTVNNTESWWWWHKGKKINSCTFLTQQLMTIYIGSVPLYSVTKKWPGRWESPPGPPWWDFFLGRLNFFLQVGNYFGRWENYLDRWENYFGRWENYFGRWENYF